MEHFNDSAEENEHIFNALDRDKDGKYSRLQCRYNMVNFLPIPHNRHQIAHMCGLIL